MLQGPMSKLPFLLVDVFMTKRAFQSPTPPPSPEERRKYEERHGALLLLDRLTTGPLAALFVVRPPLSFDPCSSSSFLIVGLTDDSSTGSVD